MKAYVGQTRSRALAAELEKHSIGECVVTGELPPRRISVGFFHDPGGVGTHLGQLEIEHPGRARSFRQPSEDAAAERRSTEPAKPMRSGYGGSVQYLANNAIRTTST